MIKWTLALLTLFAISHSASAESIPQPIGPVILTITGKIQNTQNGNTIRLDLNQLKALRSDTFNLQTRWSDTVHSYHGPLLTAVLKYVGAQGSHLQLTALNDYTTEINQNYIDKYEPILAWEEDGRQLSVREKGPLWLLLPNDKFPELNAEVHSGRMIWQLSQIEIK